MLVKSFFPILWRSCCAASAVLLALTIFFQSRTLWWARDGLIHRSETTTDDDGQIRRKYLLFTSTYGVNLVADFCVDESAGWEYSCRPPSPMLFVVLMRPQPEIHLAFLQFEFKKLPYNTDFRLGLWSIRIPFWMLAILFSVAPAIWGFQWRKRRRMVGVRGFPV